METYSLMQHCYAQHCNFAVSCKFAAWIARRCTTKDEFNMASMLYRLGHWSASRRRLVLVTWVAILIGAIVWSTTAQGSTNDEFSIPGTESQVANELLSSRFGSQSGSTARIAVQAPDGMTFADPSLTGVVADMETALQKSLTLPGVAPDQNADEIVTVSDDESIAFATVRFTEDAMNIEPEEVQAVLDTIEEATPDNVELAFGGNAVDAAVAEEHPPSEAIGLMVAVVVLLFSFGSVVAMGLPLITALIGVAITLLSVSIASAYIDLSSTAPTLATMIGLAVGIDYALFIVTRHRGFLKEGLDVEEAAARANATSGGAVVFAGVTVVIALSGLSVVGIPFLTVMGLAAAASVMVAVLVAITLIPALLGFAGRNIDRFTIPGMKASTGEGADASTTWSAKFATTVTNRPWMFLLGGVAIIALMALPLASMRLGMPDDGNRPEDTTQRQAFDILEEGFGAGFSGPLTVVVDLSNASGDAQTTVAALGTALADTDDVASVGQAVVNPAGDTALLSVVPASSPASKETEDLLHELRDDTIPPVVDGTGVTAAITGPTAVNIDISEKMTNALVPFMAVVIGLTVLLLLIVFRSILVPIKAAIAILLSIGASLGIVVAIFQWGWLADLIGVEQTGPIVSFLPIMMFGILFGLSMDYEVFILSRIKEDFARTGNARGSVLTGVASSARVITAAALIMISVFAAFVLGDDSSIKMMGVALASAVFIDATVVRMIIVPSVMTLFDKAGWWLPNWLNWLPDLDVEGENLLHQLGDSAAVTPAS